MITFTPPATAVTAESFERNGHSFDPDLHAIVTPEDVVAAEWTQHILDKYADRVIAYSISPVFGNDTFVIELQFADTPAGRATADECVKEYKSGFGKGGVVPAKKKMSKSKAQKRLFLNRMYLLCNGQYFWYFARWDHHGNVIGKVEAADGTLRNKIIHRTELEKAELIPKGEEPWAI